MATQKSTQSSTKSASKSTARKTGTTRSTSSASGASKKAVTQATNTIRREVRKSAKKHPLIWILIILALVVTVFILTPVENPVKTQLVFDSVSGELAIPAYSKDDIIVQHTGYTLSFNDAHKQPNWVAYLLTADKVFSDSSGREDNFREDPSIPTGSATLADYRGSGYDRGHLIPAADQKWSAQAMDDSFFLSNMSPQTHTFNAGIWSKLESAVRTMAAQNQEICVVTGPVLTDGPYTTIGASKVSVPNSFYKVILDYYGPEKKAIGFVLAQDAKGNLSAFAMTVDDVESLTGIDFFPLLPDDEENALEGTCDVSLWDLGDFNRTQTAKKYGYDLDGAGYNADSAVYEAKPQGVWENIQYFLYSNFGSKKLSVLQFADGLFKKEQKL
ncbi:MAG: DNA/RNA non-specific endonuclease [Spirochaetales bacterium]|nr:DNA/RNA non-specific endonuclease [Spirochaetales bacterium]